MSSAEDWHFIDHSVGTVLGVRKLAGNHTGLRLSTHEPNDLNGKLHHQLFPPCFFSTLAHASFNATVRLKTGFPGLESGSAQKYPRRSNW